MSAVEDRDEAGGVRPAPARPSGGEVLGPATAQPPSLERGAGSGGARGASRAALRETSGSALAETSGAALREASLSALWVWAATRIGTFLLGWVAVYHFAEGPLGSYLQRWAQWDWHHFEFIARNGYDSRFDPNIEAFFPGLPLVLRAVHTVGVDYVLAGLLVSFVAGAFGAVALARLAELDGPRGAGERAVLLLTLSPAAVFLAAGYAEALFLGCALPAWLCARRGHWWAAGLLAALASTTRVSGVFLAVALVVQFAVGPLRRDWRQAPALVLPFLPVLGYMAYLRNLRGPCTPTSDEVCGWLAWQRAQERGWGRSFSTPWDVLANTWDAAFGQSQAVPFRMDFRLELLAMAVGVGLTVFLLVRREWGEATFVGLSVAALG
ncbi:mannosyltransferase family protein, partial [Motilibacter deserti]